jgi:hypothetical protein
MPIEHFSFFVLSILEAEVPFVTLSVIEVEAEVRGRVSHPSLSASQLRNLGSRSF